MEQPDCWEIPTERLAQHPLPFGDDGGGCQLTDLTTLRTAEPGTGELLDAIERLIDAGRIAEVDEILAEREAALRDGCKQLRTLTIWEGARGGDET
jgi:hypothetical protein